MYNKPETGANTQGQTLDDRCPMCGRIRTRRRRHAKADDAMRAKPSTAVQLQLFDEQGNVCIRQQTSI